MKYGSKMFHQKEGIINLCTFTADVMPF